MFVELKNYKNINLKESFEKESLEISKYMSESFDVSVVGIGESGSEAVNSYNLSLTCLEYVDSLTVFDFNKEISSDNKSLCENACKNSQWLFVLADLAEQGSIELCKTLVDNFRRGKTDANRYIVKIATLLMKKKYVSVLIRCFMRKTQHSFLYP